MKVFIIGNTGSGKSTLADSLSRVFLAEVVSIDNFRKLYGDFSWEKEKEAVDRFIDRIDTESRNQIIECSGTGKTGERIRQVLPRINDKVLIVGLVCDAQTCIERSAHKLWHELKMPRTKIEVIQHRMREYNTQKILAEDYFRFSKMALPSMAQISLSENVKLIKQQLS